MFRRSSWEVCLRLKVPPHSGGFSAYLILVALAFLVMGRKQLQVLFVFLFRVDLWGLRRKDPFPVSNSWSCQLKEGFHFRVPFCLLTILLLGSVLHSADEI